MLLNSAEFRSGYADASSDSRIYATVERFDATEGRPDGVSGILAIDADRGEWHILVERDDISGPRLGRGGKRLAFRDNGPDSRLWLLEHPWESGPRPVGHLGEFASFVWSGSGEELFVSVHGLRTRPRVWCVPADGSDWVRLPFSGGEEIHDCSPEGQWVLTGEGRVEIVRPDGSDGRLLTRPGELGIRPRFSPDGLRVVYASPTPDGESLWIVDIDEGDRHQVLAESPVTIVACWSPDGSRLALRLCDCVRNDRGLLTVPRDLALSNPRVEIIDADGARRRPLDLPPGGILLGDWG